MSLDWTPPHQHTKHWNMSLPRRLVVVAVLTGEDLRDVPGGHGYSRSAREPQPVGDRCGRTRRNVDIAENRRNGPQPSTRHDDDDGMFNDHCIAYFQENAIVKGFLEVGQYYMKLLLKYCRVYTLLFPDTAYIPCCCCC